MKISGCIVVLFLSVCCTVSKGIDQVVSPEEILKIDAAIPSTASVKPITQRKLLVFTMDKSEQHASVPYGSKAMELMGKKTAAFEIQFSSDPSVFHPDKLKEFDAVCFNNSGFMDFFENQDLQKSLLGFVRSGRGLICIHSTASNFDPDYKVDWPDGARMIGGICDGQPWINGTQWAVKIDEPGHPLNKAFEGRNFSIDEELYQFRKPYSRDKLRVLISVDTSDSVTGRQKGKREDNDYAISWIHRFGRGRVFYSSLGHSKETFWNKAIMQHFLDGIQYALGDLNADDKPSNGK